jgi:hypothetical protein
MISVINYIKASNDLVQEFCKKQECDCDKVVEQDIFVGAVLIADCYFTFSDIFHDLNTNQPKGKIFEWYWKQLDKKQWVNYKTYTQS